MAGLSLTLTCSTSIQEGINGSSTLTWIRDSIEQPGEDRSGFLSLSLIPLHTSHGGVYICIARLTIPEAGVDVTESNMTTITVQSNFYHLLPSLFLCMTLIVFSFPVPPPLLTVTGFPRNTTFIQGLDLTFTCDITLDEAVDTSVTVQGNWKRNGTDLVDDDRRITVSNPPMEASPYQTTIRFNLTDAGDTGMYECIATVTPHDSTFVIGTTSSNSMNITILGII